MAVRPHVSFTLFDEIALGLRRITQASFEHILLVQQFVYRAAGIAGLYLIVSAAGVPFCPLLRWSESFRWAQWSAAQPY